MRIWVDADACPNVIKDILFRAAERAHVNLTLVANQPVRIPPSPYIKMLQVPSGFDVADDRIVELTEAGDLVVTADIPLAAGVIEKGGQALDPRGEIYTRDNIKERLAVRKLMDELRSSGVDTGGPATFSNADRQAFASKLDRILAGA
jgi:uncharacterized protein YaiI (UPF0178 family)